MLRSALLLAAVLGSAAAYSTGSYDNDRYNNDRYGNNYNNQNQQMYNNRPGQLRTKDIFCFLNATNIVKQPYHDIHSETKGPFGIQNIKAELCTHIVYNAVELDLNRYDVRPTDPEYERTSGSRITFSELTMLKHSNSHLKLILSVSGRSSDFSALARNTGQHATFANNVNHYLRKIRFDGISIDWQFPTREDKGSFSLFMTSLKNTLRSEGYLLATVLPTHMTLIQDIYDQPQNLFDAVDYWFIMATDISRGWYEIRAPAPMDTRDGDGIKKIVIDLKRIFSHYSYKLILAIPFGGKQLTLNHEISEHEVPYNKGKSTIEEPFAYNRICRIISQSQWRQSWSPLEEVPYAVGNQKRVMAYDNAQSVKIKTQYAIRSGLGGVMAYSIDMDDYDGTCNQYGFGNNYNNRRYMDEYNEQNDRGVRDRSEISYPLLRSIHETIQRDGNSAGVRTSSLALVLAVALALIFNHNG